MIRTTKDMLCKLMLMTVWIAAAAHAEDRPPNFIVIFTDDQGYQDVGCFGSPDIRTPRLDAMATQGMKFTSFYAQPICGPSRAALMTGCYPMRVAERGNVKQVHPILHSDEITIAELLKTKGYATACFGKWDLAKHAQNGFFADLLPTHQGFDYFFGTPTSNDSFANLYRNEELIEPQTNMATLTKRYTDEAIRFMQKSKQRPFFVYLPHTMPHTRLDASEQFKGKSNRGLYGDVIEEIDFNVGRIIDAVNEMGLAEQTYVLFTSDNGPWLIKNKDHADGHLPSDHGGSAGPLRSGKVSTFEGGVRVPTILWGPGRVPPEQRVIRSPAHSTSYQHSLPWPARNFHRTASSTAKIFDSCFTEISLKQLPIRRTSITCAFTFRPSAKGGGSCTFRGTKNRSEPLRSAGTTTSHRQTGLVLKNRFWSIWTMTSANQPTSPIKTRRSLSVCWSWPKRCAMTLATTIALARTCGSLMPSTHVRQSRPFPRAQSEPEEVKDKETVKRNHSFVSLFRLLESRFQFQLPEVHGLPQALFRFDGQGVLPGFINVDVS